LGQLSANPFAPDSTANPFGVYGSRYSPDSINNPFGLYGSLSLPSLASPFGTMARAAAPSPSSGLDPWIVLGERPANLPPATGGIDPYIVSALRTPEPFDPTLLALLMATAKSAKPPSAPVVIPPDLDPTKLMRWRPDCQTQECGAVRFRGDPATALVFIDGAFVGIVDEFGGLSDHLRIPVGQHRIEVKAPGYLPWAETIDVGRGTGTARPRLKRNGGGSAPPVPSPNPQAGT
jgi:hypothetical protein